MSKSLLISRKFKPYGWCLFIPSFILLVLLTSGVDGIRQEWLEVSMPSLFDNGWDVKNFFGWDRNDITDEILCIIFLIGSYFITFSKEKVEDDFIRAVRSDSWMWSVRTNYTLLALGIIFLYGKVYFNFHIYNVFTVIILFILRFNYLLKHPEKYQSYEK